MHTSLGLLWNLADIVLLAFLHTPQTKMAVPVQCLFSLQFLNNAEFEQLKTSLQTASLLIKTPLLSWNV